MIENKTNKERKRISNFITKYITTILVSLIFLHCTVIYSQIQEEPSDIFVFVSIDSKNPSDSVVNLYQDVQYSIRTNYPHKFRIRPLSEASSFVKPTTESILNSVLYIDRSEFLGSKKVKTPIKTFQAVLETIAVNDIFVIDCEQRLDGTFESCGIYVYNRLKKGLSVAVEKRFSTPINDISSWGSILVDRLVTNLEELKQERTQEKLDKLLNDSEETSDEITSHLELAFGIKHPNRFVNSLNGGNIGIFASKFEHSNSNESINSILNTQVLTNWYAGFSLGYYTGKYSKEQPKRKLKVNQLTLGLVVGKEYYYQSYGLNVGIEAGLGYSNLKLLKYFQSTNSMKNILEQDDALLGFGIKITKNFQNVGIYIKPEITKHLDININKNKGINKYIGHTFALNFGVDWAF